MVLAGFAVLHQEIEIFHRETRADLQWMQVKWFLNPILPLHNPILNHFLVALVHNPKVVGVFLGQKDDHFFKKLHRSFISFVKALDHFIVLIVQEIISRAVIIAVSLVKK